MANFTRKHYEKVAETIRKNIRHEGLTEINHENQIINELSESFADMFQADNERFNRDRFMKACGFNDCPHGKCNENHAANEGCP